MSELTVIVPTWPGRTGFVERLIAHAAGTGYEIRVVPNRGGQDYFDAVAKAVAEVKTPYCMRADDDDFLGDVGGCLNWLDSNSDYVAALGKVAGFTLWPALGKPTGKINRRFLYYVAQDLSQTTAHGRLKAGALKLWVYYAVHRTSALQTITKEISEIGFSDLLLYEAFHTMRTLTLGKVHFDGGSISYFRQHGTSSSSDNSRRWVSDFLRSRSTDDIRSMLGIIGDEAAIVALEEKYRQFLRAIFSDKQRIKWAISDKYPSTVSKWQSRWRYFGFRPGVESPEWEGIAKICSPSSQY